MDGQKQAESAPTGEPEKRPRHSFMDVRRPKPKDPATGPVKPADEAPKADATPAVEEKVAAAPPEENPGEITDDPAEKLADETKKTKPAKAPKPPRQPGVGFAIFATIIIILGLGVLATYAYLRTNNLAPF